MCFELGNPASLSCGIADVYYALRMPALGSGMRRLAES